jgi:leucyl-tRNA synthetase
MRKEYNHLKVEKKWQIEWEKKKAFNLQANAKGKKFYSLMEFPYPSGDGLHTGHVRGYTAMDIISHKRRAEGYNVLFPIGWDAFGLPTENYAIKTGTPPEVVTKRNTDNFRKQFRSLGMSFDWSREINTTDPKYYKWTQWIFLQLLKNDLAYKAKMTVNWCPKDKTGLANEEVVNGCCERCGTPVEKREKEQWMLRITKYADRLDKDLDLVDYLEKIKIQQRNWIGKSEGAEIDFDVWRNNEKIKVFTTRPDTIYGATYVVLAPEHELVSKLWDQIENKDEVSKYIEEVKNKSDIERTNDEKDKTGIRISGVSAVNPANKEVLPVFIADYVLSTYGTGAIMAVPAHDERDFKFAKKYNLPIREVVSGDGRDGLYTGSGIVKNSDKFDGMPSELAKKEITKHVGGKIVTKYKLRDWVFSRQRYWGEPIPVVNCGFCGYVPVPEKQLPIKLPKVKNYAPRDDGESPLASMASWVNTTCPKCKRRAKRETDTMPNWAGSSWYFLRYLDPKNNSKLADIKKLNKFMPVDWYNGGMEHTTLHLLYSRFWHKFLNDIKVVPGKEPYKKRTSHGLILAKGGEKMSKSKGNVINPNETVRLYGADTLRVYEMFMGPFDQPIAWNEDNIFGVRRFIERVWRITEKVSPKAKSEEKFEILLNKTIKKVSEDIESMSFNTAVSSMMILLNEMERHDSVKKAHFEIFLKILSPFAPHITEELWHELGHKTLLVKERWPKWNPKKLIDDEIKIGVQINSKVRAEIVIPYDSDEAYVVKIARQNPDVEKWLLGKEIKKTIFVRNKILNFVV